MTDKNPREPRNVKKLAADAQRRIDKKAHQPQKPDVNAVHRVKPSLWAKLGLRKPDKGGR